MRIDFMPRLERTWVSVGVAGVSLGVSGYKALRAHSQDEQAKREGNNLRRPFYQIQPEYYQNENIAAQQATGGFSSGEKSYIEDQRQRGLTTSLSALQQSGGGPNNFAHLNEIFNESLQSEAAQDAQLHLQNIKSYTDAAKELASQKTIQWGVNEKEPFESKLNEIMQRRIAAKTNENSAVDQGIGSLTAAATSINGYMKTQGAAPTAVTPSPYSRIFGLADTGGGAAGSPAAGFSTLDPNSYSPNALAQ